MLSGVRLDPKNGTEGDKKMRNEQPLSRLTVMGAGRDRPNGYRQRVDVRIGA